MVANSVVPIANPPTASAKWTMPGWTFFSKVPVVLTVCVECGSAMKLERYVAALEDAQCRSGESDNDHALSVCAVRELWQAISRLFKIGLGLSPVPSQLHPGALMLSRSNNVDHLGISILAPNGPNWDRV